MSLAFPLEVLAVEAVLRQRIAQTPMGSVHALPAMGLASQRAALEPLCQEALNRQTHGHGQDRALTLQQPHEEPGGGHEHQMG